MAEEQVLQVQGANPDDSDNTTTITNSGRDALSVYPSFYATAMANDSNPEMIRQKFPELDDSQFSLLTSKFYKDSSQEPQYYTVQEGDNFGSIAKNNNLYQFDLSKLNPRVKKDKLSIGQQLVVGGSPEANLSSAIYSRDVDYTNTITENINPEQKLNIIGHIETGKSAEVARGEDPYSIENSSGAMGRYQIKFNEKGPDANYRKILKDGGFDVNTKEQFLANPKAQDFLMTNLLNNDYAKQVTQIRTQATKHSSKYSDFDIMMSIHKIGYPQTLKKLKKGSLPVGEVKNLKGERIDDEVGTYVQNGRDFIKNNGYDNLLFSQENRYSRDGTRIPTNYYPDGDPELVRTGKATSSALQKSDNIKNVIINEDELDDAEFQWYTSNDYKRFTDFVRLTNSLVSKEVNQAFSFLDPSTEFGDVESAEVAINSYNEAKDNIFANQITRLQEYIESEPFERLIASIGQEGSFSSEDFDEDSDLFEVVGFSNKYLQGEAFLSKVLYDEIETQVGQVFNEAIVQNILPLLSGKENFEEYENYLEETSNYNKEYVEKFPHLIDGSAVAGGLTNTTKEDVANRRDYYTFAFDKLEGIFPKGVLDGIPAVIKEELAVRAADSHWWNTSGAKDEYDQIIAENLETYGVIDPHQAMMQWNKRYFDLSQSNISEGEMFNQLESYAKELGAFDVETSPSADGGYSMIIIPNQVNQKSFDTIQNLAYQDIENKYPKGEVDNSLEYFVKESVNKNSLGLAYTALTDRKLFSTYGYNPSESEGFWTDVGSFVFDPLFMAGGALGKAAVNYGGRFVINQSWKNTVRGAAKLEAAGYTTEQATRAYKLYSAAKMNQKGYKYVATTVPGATSFATFDAGQDVFRQKISAGEWAEVDYIQSLKSGGKGFILGFGVSNVGYGFGRMYNQMAQRGIPKYAEWFAKPVEFGAEVSAFTLGSSVLHGTDIKFQDFVETGKFLGGLKLTHGIRNAPHKILKTAENIKNHRSLYAPKPESRYDAFGKFSESERKQIIRELDLEVNSSPDKVFESLALSPDNLIKALNSKNVDIYLKQKLNYAFFNSVANVTNSKTGDIDVDAYFTTVPKDVKMNSMVNPKSGKIEYTVDILNNKGEKLYTEIFESKSEALKAEKQFIEASSQGFAFESMINLKRESVSDFNTLLEKNGITESHLVEIFEKGVTNVAPEVRNKVMEMANEASAKATEINKNKIAEAEAFMPMDKPSEMRSGDPALYGQYLRMQKEGKEMTTEQKAELERLNNTSGKELDSVYSEVMGKERTVEVKEPTVEKEVKEEAPEVKTEEAPVEGESKTYFHGSKDKPVISSSMSRFEKGMGMHFGVNKQQAEVRNEKKGTKDGNIFEYNLEPKNSLKVERDFVWEGNEAAEKRFKEDPNAYLREKEQNKELGIESDWFGDYLLDNKIVTQKELQKDPSPAGIRKLLVDKGFDSINYLNTGEVAKGGKPDRSIIALTPDIIKEIGAKPEVKLSNKKETFTQELDKAKSEKPEDYWSVDKVDSKDLKGSKLIEVDGGYGVVTKEGDIKGVFKKPDSKEKGVGDKIIQKAVEEGGRTLDNYDGYLTKIYEKNGFRVVSRTPFNEQYAPEGYNKEKHGTPDIVTMIYDPLKKLDIQEKTFKGETGYDKAIEYRNSFLEQSQKEYKPLSEKQKTRKKFNERIKQIRSEYQGKIDLLKEGTREKANKIKEVRSNLTEVINETNFSGPITKNLLKKASNVKNEKGLENFVQEIEKLNYRNDVKNINEDINSLKRSVRSKLQSGEFGDIKTKALVNDLLDINFREIETTMGTAEGQTGMKLLNDVKLAMEQLARPRVGAVAGKSSQSEMKSIIENANKLVSEYRAKKESDKIKSQTDAVTTVEQVESLVKEQLSKVEGFEFEAGSLTGSEVRSYSSAALRIRRAQQKLNEALDAGIIESKVYNELSDKIEIASEELLSKRGEFTKASYNEGIEYMREVLNNFESYPNYTSQQKALLEKVINSEYIDKIGYAEDVLVSGIDAANGYFPTKRLGELSKESMGFKHGNPLYRQIRLGLESKPSLAQKSDTNKGADLLLRDMEFIPLSFLTGKANAEKTGRTLDEVVITPITRSMTSAKADINTVVQEWNKITSSGTLSRLFSPSSPMLRRKQLNETMEKLGMIMLEKQYEVNGGNGSFVDRAIRENTNDYGTGDAKRLQEAYNKLPKKTVDGKEMIDWNEAYKGLSKKEKEIYDYVRGQFEGNLRDKQRFVNEYRGKEFQDFESYVPLMRFGKVGIEDFKSIDFVEQIAQGKGKTGLAAGVGKERTTIEPSAVEFNIESLLMRSVVQTNRDFHMTPTVRESFQIIANAQNEFKSIQQETPTDQTNLNVGKYLDAYKERMQQSLGVQFDVSGYQQSFMPALTQRLSGAAYAASLNRPGRLAVETGVEYLRVGVGASTPETPNVIINQFKENMERIVGARFEDGKIKFGRQDNTANDLMNFTNSQFRLKFNKHSINGEYDVLSGLYRNGALKTLNDFLISAPDRATVYLAWMPTFQTQFKEITGASFNRKEYRQNPSYRKQFEKEIFDAAAIADREAVKWKNTTLKGGGRSQIKLPFGSVDVNNRTLAPIVTYMSNFGALESLNFGRSARNIYFGNTPTEKANALKQISAQFAGGVAYGIGTSMEFLMYQQLVAESEPNTTKRAQMLSDIDEKRRELFSTEGIIKTSAANATFLLTSKYSQVGRNLMLLTAGALQGLTGDKEMDDLISEFTKIAYYAEPLNLEGYGPKTEVIRAAAPMYYNAIEIVMDNAEAIRNYKEATDGSKSFTDPEGREAAALFDMLVNLQRALLLTQGTSIPFNKDVEYLSRYGIAPLGGLDVEGPTKGTERTKKFFKE